MTDARRTRPKPRPLDESALQELALRYVGRFATTRAKLRTYLARKVRERGWAGAAQPDLAALSDRLADHGYVDDAGYALSKARNLTGRGFGRRRVADSLRAAGIGEEDGAGALGHAADNCVRSAIRFAERRRIGPFAPSDANDPRLREKWIAAMVRTGHGFDTARTIAHLSPGEEIDVEELTDRVGRHGS